MRKPRLQKYLMMTILGLLLVISIAACSVTKPAPPASIGEVVTARNVDAQNKPVDQTTTFQPDDTIHTSVQVNNLIVGSKVVVKYKFGSQVTEQPLVADQAGSGYYDFSLEPGNNGFPVGIYTVEVYLDDTLAKTMTLEVAR